VPELPEPLSLLDGLHSTPSRRYLSTEPIPEHVLWSILDAAVRGPSGGNRQEWGWVVVTDQSIKDAVAPWYREGWRNAFGHRREEIMTAPPRPEGLTPRAYLAMEHLAEQIEEAPVWIIPVLRNAATATSPRAGASIYGAVQQLCLAARAYGIGTTLTNFQSGHEAELAQLLDIPPDAATMALIPMGYPTQGHWSEPKRRPLQEVVHWQRWGAAHDHSQLLKGD
jgi:nitroreductase